VSVHRSVVAVALFGLFSWSTLGCDRHSNEIADAGTSREPAPATAESVNANAKPPPARPVEKRPVAAPSVTIEGLGTVPGWALDQTTRRCVAPPESKAKIEAVRKRSDVALASGLAQGHVDLDAFVKDVGADTCIVTRRLLANALEEVGRGRRDAKAIDEANHYWRAALVVRPSLIAARYDLARGLAVAGKGDAAVAQLGELARAAGEGDANASVALEQAKTEKDLESVRKLPAFDAAVKASSAATLIGPRKDPDTSAKAVALLPEDLKKRQDDIGATPNRAIVTYKPAFTSFWTWHPDPSTELLVATVVDDPAKIGQPKADVTLDYGAIAILRKDATGKVTLLTIRKTGDSQPAVAGGKNGSVIYSFEQVCGGLSGALTWNGKSVDMNEKSCRDLP
jgi:hypothetical protein